MKKNILVMLFILSLILISGCTPDENDDPVNDPSNEETNEPSTDQPEDPNEYQYDGEETKSPYYVYSEDGELLGEYESMFVAIRNAGANSTSKNKCYVLDANNVKIFQRSSNTKGWCYDGTHFVGLKTKAEAEQWCNSKIKGYVINGLGTGILQVGTNYYDGSDLNQNIPLELISGGYNYLFSKGGVIQSDEWIKRGYGYAEFICRLSEANYKPTQDGTGWNAYIFINGAAGSFTCDLGLIGSVRNGQVVWALVRNCSHTDHKTNEGTFGPSFTVLNWTPVTTMSYDAANDCYNGADDLKFVCYQGVDGWTLTITNMRTNQDFVIKEQHKGMFSESTQYMRFLLAASYCPVVNNVWNARCGAYLRNVIFEDVKIAEWNESETYLESSYEDFYPGSDNMLYGFSQGADCASMVYDAYESDGTYKSGNTYKKGDKYISFSCYYDGGEH